MGFKLLSVAVLAAIFGAASAQAQSVARVGGPANLPPAGYEGQQWVDSRGCVFLKAGYGGQVTWVPRVGRDRRAMCGFPPTGSTRAPLEVATAAEMAAPAVTEAAPRTIAAAEPVMQPVNPQAPRAQTARPAAPSPTILAAPQPAPVPAAPRLTARPAPYVETAPRDGYEVVASGGPSAGQIGCYASAPVAERVKTRNGGTAVVCTRGDGSLTGWRPPVYPRSAGVGAALADPIIVTRNSHQTHGGLDHTGYTAEARTLAAPTNPPKGYKVAWDDGRLNPNRGKGTAQGWSDQDQVWTRDVPSKLATNEPQRKKKTAAKSSSTLTTSTKGQPATAPVQPKAAKGGAYIQVGTFGVPSNADGAAARLKGIGLPVARAKISSGGKAMQIVLAGPFGSAADAATALSMARSAGFGDAFIR